ncbi:MAG: 16S rRNA (cytidine(1402)-2'-O)-methyltransferase [Alphaproteobacteria bacterium]|nr:16S rRNA (cytidine(1402)-2'-O)-methyltransferase [Alphaproteobacteria bacterium]
MDTSKAQPSQTYPSGLYIVATPIGNLRDITLRALDILALADVVLCEDTRVSGKLMSHYGLDKKLLSYHDHNGELRRPQIMGMLAEGKRLALISDAGTPLISDPGYKLVRDVQAAGYYVSAAPGASSVMAALCLSGLPTNRFHFVGFLPAKKQALADELRALSNVQATLVIFESAKRLDDACAAMLEAFGDREVAVVREITKMFEESRKDKLSAHLAHYRKHGLPKGEVVMVVAPPEEAEKEQDITALLTELLATHSLKEAAQIAAEQTGKPRKEVYAAALSLK